MYHLSNTKRCVVKAFIEREQLREELENTRARFEEHVAKMQKNISDACDLTRREGQSIQNELETRVCIRNRRIE